MFLASSSMFVLYLQNKCPFSLEVSEPIPIDEMFHILKAVDVKLHHPSFLWGACINIRKIGFNFFLKLFHILSVMASEDEGKRPPEYFFCNWIIYFKPLDIFSTLLKFTHKSKEHLSPIHIIYLCCYAVIFWSLCLLHIFFYAVY